MLEDKLNFSFEHSFVDNLGDLYEKCRPESVSSPSMLFFNYQLAEELNLDPLQLNSDEGLQIFSGNKVPKGSIQIAQAYAGHQFGHYNPIMGDGRAILLGEVIDANKRRRDIQLKGSGQTPFSRRGDGKSALGPVLREYLISESMHALGIPTSRSLAAVKTGENVLREDIMPGGILTRVAASHIRIGTFEFASKLQDKNAIKKLADYSINRHFPETADVENPYLAFFAAVCNEQASLVAKWMSIGFVHGVMNTDNMTISGETIDYGPCAFMDIYNPSTVFSSIDVNGRYAYGNQPGILTWNLTRLAEALLPLINENKDESIRLLTEVLQLIKPVYTNYWLNIMRSKIGLSKEEQNDIELIISFLEIMEEEKVDFTIAFRLLAKSLVGDSKSIKKLFNNSRRLDGWMMVWHERLSQEGIDDEKIAFSMNKINPVYIPRNHKVEEALKAAVSDNNLEPFTILYSILQSPYDEVNGLESFTRPPSESDIPYRTFCGT
ncbi:MAG: hypothetical protein CBE02_01060 [Gammaproteobacteria bacterium TMED242]|nr:MAG: hypothetical protein CBE02_01060 [Gammaproteobacteria bacterium TMED242]